MSKLDTTPTIVLHRYRESLRAKVKSVRDDIKIWKDSSNPYTPEVLQFRKEIVSTEVLITICDELLKNMGCIDPKRDELINKFLIGTGYYAEEN